MYFFLNVTLKILTHDFFADRVEDLKPILDSDASDSASLDAAFEILLQTDRSLPMTKSMIIPESLSNNNDMPDELKKCTPIVMR